MLVDDRFVSAGSPHANYDVSPDGKQLLVLEAVEEVQIIVIHNWRQAVRERVRGGKVQ